MAEPIVEPLCELPVCMICKQPLIRLTQPVLLPCTHYVVCSTCWEQGTDGPGRVKCPYCPQIYSELTRDVYITEVGNRLRGTPKEALAPAEEEEKYQLARYLLDYKETHSTDLAQIPLVFADSQARGWDCTYCSERANDQQRCRLCNRVNLDCVEEEPLPESIAALFARNEAVESSIISLKVLEERGKVGFPRAILENSSSPEIPSLGQSQAPSQSFKPPMEKAGVPRAIPEDSSSQAISASGQAQVHSQSFKPPMAYAGNKPKEIGQVESEQSFLIDESGEGMHSAILPDPGVSSLPRPQPRPVPAREPEYIQLPPEPILPPTEPIPPRKPPRQEKWKCPCCLLL